jgi:predicted DNA-binding transcriptional regulator AlpA
MTQRPNFPDYVRTRKETAKILGVSLRTLTRMETQGKMPARIRVSDRITGYRDSTIQKFLEDRVVR